MKKHKLIISFLLVFSFGVILGATGMRTYTFFMMQKFLDGGPAGSGMRTMILGHLQNELDLTPEQHDKVDIELQKAQKTLRSFESTMQPVLDKQFLESIDTLKNVLSEKQIQKLVSLHDEMEKKRKKILTQE